MNIENPSELVPYLRERGLVDDSRITNIERLTGGISSRVVRVETADGGLVLKQGLARLRVTSEWQCDPARTLREALALEWLRTVIPKHTVRLIDLDESNFTLTMDAVAHPSATWKELLLDRQIDDQHTDSFADLLSTVHRAGGNCESVPTDLRDRSYFQTLRLEPYYGEAAQRAPQVAHFLTDLCEECLLHQVTIVHGDPSPKNVLIRQNRLTLVDHEVVHFGDPAFDIGFYLTHLMAKANHMPDQRGMLCSTAARFWRRYVGAVGSEAWFPGLESRAIRHLAGCLLARVDGRSPLAYLRAPERDTQRRTSLSLMMSLPSSLEEAIERFEVACAKAADR